MNNYMNIAINIKIVPIDQIYPVISSSLLFSFFIPKTKLSKSQSKILHNVIKLFKSGVISPDSHLEIACLVTI